MPTSILRLTFQTAQGNRRSLSVRNPIDEPTVVEVEPVMDKIIEAGGIFETPAGDLTTKLGAVVVTTETTEIADFTQE